jgi:hypothetical protein
MTVEAMTAMKRAATTALAAALISGLMLVTTPAADAAAPLFQMPFPCGQAWEGQTRADHSPPNAVDLNRANDAGDPVAAAASGRVSRSESEGNQSYGEWIEIDHGDWTTRYAHLSTRRVFVGDVVSPGQLIGNVGNTGGSTGAHLHFEERNSGGAQRISFNGTQIRYWGTGTYTSRNNCAANNPYTPRAICGSGYQVIDWAPIGTAGAVYLLYRSDGANCVATVKHVAIGTPSPASAYLTVQGAAKKTDSGNFGYYAGPVSAAADGKCVQWGGSIGSASYTSPFEHCG